MREVDTPLGVARLHLDHAVARRSPRGTLILGHGAGGGVDARDLAVLATQLPPAGFDVVRVEQPWRVRGGRVAVAPPRLDVAWLHCLRHLSTTTDVSVPWIVGGRSAGARVAFRCVGRSDRDVAGAIGLSFPLHPPGRPERDRRAEITTEVPVLIVQGDRDPFGSPPEFEGVPVNVDLAVVPGADHGLRVRRTGVLTQAEAEELIVERCRNWISDLVARESTGVAGC